MMPAARMNNPRARIESRPERCTFQRVTSIAPSTGSATLIAAINGATPQPSPQIPDATVPASQQTAVSRIHHRRGALIREASNTALAAQRKAAPPPNRVSATAKPLAARYAAPVPIARRHNGLIGLSGHMRRP